MVGHGLGAWYDTWSMGAPKTKPQFQRGMVERGWGGVAKPHHNEVPPWLVLLANHIPQSKSRSPAPRPG
ncbi:hypothetical protein HanPI659440_Chr03g0124071 [Helianthus annuus]|nr:hypothetical protein HanPI659440_Chr03g0124071 [Helianthus annuus]